MSIGQKNPGSGPGIIKNPGWSRGGGSNVMPAKTPDILSYLT